jgi:alkylation response protein AidB-like acyl-CoA dehydrogenase
MAETATEGVDEFRQRARLWLKDHMPLAPAGRWAEAQIDSDGQGARQLQRRLFDGGFAGICFPVRYGGQGLSRHHQAAFTEESLPYEMPVLFNVPTLSILAPTILDFGTDAQRDRHLPAILRGDELWVQFLSEPSGGSDLAGLVTRATPDGDVFVMNGSKIWSTGAYRADYALCLARTNWDAPKHRGLTMFIVKIHQPGIDVNQIKMVDGRDEFCQEYFNDVSIPAADVVGQVHDGWTVASRLLYHERDAVGGGSPYVSGGGPGARSGPRRDLRDLAQSTGTGGDRHVRQLVAEDWANHVVQLHLIDRVTTGIRTGAFPPLAGAILRLSGALTTVRHDQIGLELAGSGAAAWSEDDPAGYYGTHNLARQGACLGGGSNEMQRNIISERVLGMPREYAADRDKPFNEVRRNATALRSPATSR